MLRVSQVSEVAQVWQEDMVLGGTLENLEEKATKVYMDLMWVPLNFFKYYITHCAPVMDTILKDIFILFLLFVYCRVK